jgi:hypothetical protein
MPKYRKYRRVFVNKKHQDLYDVSLPVTLTDRSKAYVRAYFSKLGSNLTGVVNVTSGFVQYYCFVLCRKKVWGSVVVKALRY